MVAQPRERLRLQEYIRDALPELGAAIEETGTDTLDALLPEGLAAALGTESLVHWTFDPELAEEMPGTTLITFGHPILDRFNEAAMAVGRVQRRYAWVPSIRVPGDLEDRLRRAVQFAGCRPLVLTGAELVWLSVLHLELALRLHGDEESVRFAPVCVDLWQGCHAPHLVEPLARALSAPTPDITPDAVGLPWAPLTPRERVLAAAGSAATTALQRACAAYGASLSARESEELARLDHYYAGLAQDLNRRVERAKNDPQKMEQLQSRLQACTQEHTRRRNELRERFRVWGEWEPDQAIWYLVPGILATVEVQQRRDIHLVKLAYNLLTHEPELPGCTVCATRAPRPLLRPSQSGSVEPICPACA